MLHHIDTADLLMVLGELKRVGQRLIIEEVTFDVPDSVPELDQLKKVQPELREFVGLAVNDQVQVLLLVDYFSNAIAQGVVDMNFPFQFKSIPQWKDVLAKAGFDLMEVKLLGFQPGNVSKTGHVWLVADRHN